MTKLNNKINVEGYLYEHKLEVKTTGENSKNPGTDYITGTISIATDAGCLNIVPIHYTYVVPFFPAKDGKPPKANRNHAILTKILNKELKTVVEFGVEEAAILHVDSALDTNEWYNAEKDEFITSNRNEGGFITEKTMISDIDIVRNHFETDVVIGNVSHREADEDKKIEECAVIKAYVFNFRGEALPFTFYAYKPGAIAYFEDLGASSNNPVFTKIWGNVENTTTVVQKITESAFGDPEIREYKNSKREYVVTGAAVEPYIWDSEETMLASAFQQKLSDREVKLATLKSEAQKAKMNPPSAISNDNFGF